MKQHNEKPITDDRDNDVRRLLNIAGRRLAPPKDVRDRVFENVLHEWENQPIKSNKTFTPKTIQSIAASFLLALITIAGGWKFILNDEEFFVGELAFSSGQFSILGDQKLHDNFLPDGAMIHTGEDGRLDVHVLKTTSVRIDVSTQISFRKNAELWLHSGRIYVDSPSTNEGVKVITPYGPVTDIGTQFSVDIGGNELVVAVREGLVNIDLDSGKLALNAENGRAEVITISKEDEFIRTQVSSSDSRWDWIHLAAAEYQLENSTVHDFLIWVSRESGLKLVFETNHALIATKQARLHGSLDGMKPNKAIGAILSTTRFGSRVTEQQELIVFIKQ